MNSNWEDWVRKSDERMLTRIIDTMETAFGDLGQETDGMSSYDPLAAMQAVKERLAHLQLQENVIKALREFKEIKKIADENPHHMLHSGMPTEEAARIMTEYSQKEEALFNTLSILDAAESKPS